MDLIIKNLERLKDYSDGNHKPIERVVVDFDKLATEDFAQLFFNACEDIKMSDLCAKCKNYRNGEKTVNCKSYISPEFSCYEEKPKISDKPCNVCKNFEKKSFLSSCNVCQSDTNHPFWKLDVEKAKLQSSSIIKDSDHFKEITERMKGEFDATGKDVKIFMNERVIKR